MRDPRASGNWTAGEHAGDAGRFHLWSPLRAHVEVARRLAPKFVVSWSIRGKEKTSIILRIP